MSPGELIAIIVAVVLACILGVMLGIYVVVHYLTSPKGFVKDLTGNEPYEPGAPMDPVLMRMHIEILKKGEAK